MNAPMHLLLVILYLLLAVLPIPAAENGFPIPGSPASSSASGSGEAASEEPAYPSTAEVVPRAGRLAEGAGRLENRLSELQKVAPFEKQLSSARQRQKELSRRIEELGGLEDLSVNRLLELRSSLGGQQDDLDELLDTLSERLSTIEEVRAAWEQKSTFWKGWVDSLAEPKIQVHREAFRRARELIDRVREQADQATIPLAELQQQVADLQERNLEVLQRIDATLDTLRRQTMKKTALSFLEPEFYRQFDSGMWRQVTQGIRQVQGVGTEFWREQGWIPVLQLLIILTLPGFIRKHRSKAEETTEWQFIVDHPWATGIFVAVSACSFLYVRAPALWRLLLWSLAAFSAAILIAGLLRNRRKIVTVYLLAVLFIFSLALQVIAFPEPLYRLYLALLSLAGIPLLLLTAASNVKAHGGKVDGFTIALRFGALVLFASFLAQVGGYGNFSSRLIEASVETVFLGLFAAMVIRLGRGGIDYLFRRPLLKRYRFFRRSGNELAARIKGVFQLFVCGYALLYLLQAWGLYGSVGQAWSELIQLGFTVGETTVTLQMILLAVLVLYATILFSWALRALLETEVFIRRSIDRGVRDSIKKLLHYALVLVGFLAAMSMAGVGLQHFVVLAGAFGIGIGFGLQNIVNNFVSGLILLFERPIKVGDVVVLDTEWGSVKKIGLRSTVVETLDRAEIIVPNSQLISEKVTNWTFTTPVARVVVPVGVAYGSDMQQVLEILEEAAHNHPDVLEEPPPSPIFTGFGDSSLDFELRAWMSNVSKRLAIRSELGLYIDRRFREEGITIPFPQRDLHLRSVEEPIFQHRVAAEEGPAEGAD